MATYTVTIDLAAGDLSSDSLVSLLKELASYIEYDRVTLDDEVAQYMATALARFVENWDFSLAANADGYPQAELYASQLEELATLIPAVLAHDNGQCPHE